MFAVVICPGCHRPRGIKLSSQHSTCPRCGRNIEVRKARVNFQSPDAREIKAYINGMNDFIEPASESSEDVDPWTALREEITREKDPEERLNVMASGLTDLLGSFTVEDLELLAPGKGESLLMRMVEHAVVLEIAPGVYQVL